MQTISKRKPDIRFHRSGLIEILSKASKRLGLSGDQPQIALLIDKDNNLYIHQDLEEGLTPSSIKGSYFRYHSVCSVNQVFSLPDIQGSPERLSFRFGETENGLIPIITRFTLD